MKEIKIYKVTVKIRNNISTMLVSGYDSENVRSKLYEFFHRTGAFKRPSDFDIEMIEVKYVDGEYIEVEEPL